MSDLKSTHTFLANPNSNGGESFLITTDIYHNCDPGPLGIQLNQSFSLHSYGNSANISIGCMAALTPEVLRELADQLECEIAKVVLETMDMPSQP